MITPDGFEFEIDDETLDDWELLECFEGLSDSDPGSIVRFVKKLLGSLQYARLKNFLKERDGKVRASAMQAEIELIMNTYKALKK